MPRNIAANELNIVPETRLLVLLEVEGVAERLRRDRALDALAMLVILLVEVRLPPAVACWVRPVLLPERGRETTLLPHSNAFIVAEISFFNFATYNKI